MRYSALLPALFPALFLPGRTTAQASTLQTNEVVVEALRVVHDAYKKYVLDTAELVPEDLYSFRPTEEVWTLGGILAHIADANYNFCSSAAREENPATEVFRTSRTTKARIVDALVASFTYCDRVYEALADVELTERTTFLGEGDYAVATILASNSAHLGDHYGNLVTYMRINGIVPPSTAVH